MCLRVCGFVCLCVCVSVAPCVCVFVFMGLYEHDPIFKLVMVWYGMAGMHKGGFRTIWLVNL